jgi:hypothetical protein
MDPETDEPELIEGIDEPNTALIQGGSCKGGLRKDLDDEE